jgi:hypothetical protein
MDRISQFARQIHSVLGQLPDAVNDIITVVKRKRCFTPLTLAQTFILGLLQKPTASDADIAVVASRLGVCVSPQAIDQRYSKELAQFFQRLFAQMAAARVRATGSLCDLFERFTEVSAIDSTVIVLPAEMASQFPGCGGGGPAGGNAAALKLQTEINLKTGVLLSVQIESGRSPDSASDRQQADVKKGSLRLADLGYYSVSVLQRIVACAAHFVSRVQFQTRIEVDGQVLSVFAYLFGLAASVGSIDKPILLGKDTRLACRLIAWRVPAAIAARRRRTLREIHCKRGKTPSRGALAMCDWNVLITDLPQKKLTINEAIVLYRSRWQIELLFKRWKSFCGIDLLDGRSPVHVECRLWIRLCAALIQQSLVAACCWIRDRELSFAKFSRRLKDCVTGLAWAMGSTKKIAQIIRSIAAELSTSCRPSKRLKPGWTELLRDPSKLEYALTWR